MSVHLPSSGIVKFVPKKSLDLLCCVLRLFQAFCVVPLGIQEINVERIRFSSKLLVYFVTFVDVEVHRDDNGPERFQNCRQLAKHARLFEALVEFVRKCGPSISQGQLLLEN